MTFNFDMHHIGQTIARLRRERNMTQMQLARSPIRSNERRVKNVDETQL